ncbi:thioredoxin family protein [Pontibacillus litoralis]|uniref:Thioredoxin n=1 Tax=Pontibacillus litoralis JSM 072002 TaxID=1385512 RepID=A0A0A5FZG6_9BACI|nr:thioredoxin family protein [Pontibacillus litoralis]KGX86231.1 thioredoxin [Pontibacillus litoralis JSM 072002]
MNLNKWYEKGISPKEYIYQMQQNKEDLNYVYEHFELPKDEKDEKSFSIKSGLRVLVLTEDWCGDAMVNIPILLRMAEATDINVRMLYRDQNVELMDQYLTNGTSRSIPIFIFIDEDGNELGKWGPRANEVQQIVENAFASLPSEDHADYEKKKKEMIQYVTKLYREDATIWSKVYESIKTTIQSI